MSLKYRSYKKELLDADNIPFPVIRANMEELNVINSFLGGHKITRMGIALFVKKMTFGATPLSIVEIGSGGGDNLFTIHKYLNKLGIAHQLTGIDIKKECLEYAAQKHSAMRAEWICNDYIDTKFTKKQPDIIFSSLFCHHFIDDELVRQLVWMKENSRVGFFINDLHRHPLAYHSIKTLTRLFSKSALVKNDAPLSVERGFKKCDWESLLRKAGIDRYSLKWKWAFRHLICVTNEER